MAEVIALLHQENCYRGVCYKSVPLYIIVLYIIVLETMDISRGVTGDRWSLCRGGPVHHTHTSASPSSLESLFCCFFRTQLGQQTQLGHPAPQATTPGAAVEVVSQYFMVCTYICRHVRTKYVCVYM